jgi:lipopolysaccharide transport system permease protein
LQKGRAHYLDMVVILAQRDFKIRYRNSVLGFLWSLLNPLGYMLVLTLVFSVLLRVNVPNYPAFFLVGLLVWRFFSIGTSQSLFSIIGNPSLVTKLYLPRYIIVLSNNLANLLGSAIEFVALTPLLVALGVKLSVYVLLLPFILGLELLLVFGLSLALSALNLKYRDFYQLWDIALQLGFFLSPLVYAPGIVPARFQFAYSLNPVTRLVESMREIFLSQQLPSVSDITVITANVAIFLLLGFLIFRHFERRFAEEL